MQTGLCRSEEFSMLQIDNAQNRTLRWTIRLAIQLLDALPNKEPLKAALRRLDRHFLDVSIREFRPNPRQLSLGLPPNLRHYSTALYLAYALLRDLNLSADPGLASAPSVAIDMNDLYERVADGVRGRCELALEDA